MVLNTHMIDSLESINKKTQIKTLYSRQLTKKPMAGRNSSNFTTIISIFSINSMVDLNIWFFYVVYNKVVSNQNDY